jgi:hypothetical protein
MVIILDTPFSLGDLSPEKYPHVYITNLIVNGPAQTVTVMAEVGTVGENYAWTGAPANTVTQLNLSGEQLYPFFFQKPDTLETSLWDQTETLVYHELQKAFPRYAGKLGSGLPEPKPAEETPTTEEPASEPVAEPATETAPEPETPSDAST